MGPALRALTARATTRRTGLSPAEGATTAVAVVVSSAAYLAQGQPYLARGVVGDLVGFVLLGGVAATTGRRGRHEALVCLLCIGGVLLVDPAWPVRQPEPVWWAAVAGGLGAYLVVRRLVCE